MLICLEKLNCKACSDYLNAVPHFPNLIYLPSEGQFNEGIIIQELKCSFFYIIFLFNGYEYNARKNRKKYNSNCKTIILVWDCCCWGWGGFLTTTPKCSNIIWLFYIMYCKGIMCVNDWARKKKNLSKTIINLSIFIVLSVLFLHYNNDITLERKKMERRCFGPCKA